MSLRDAQLGRLRGDARAPDGAGLPGLRDGPAGGDHDLPRRQDRHPPHLPQGVVRGPRHRPRGSTTRSSTRPRSRPPRTARSGGARLRTTSRGSSADTDQAPEALDAILRSHLIDPALLRADDFEGFIAQRRAALGDLVGRVVERVIRDAPVDEPEYDVAPDEDDVERAAMTDLPRWADVALIPLLNLALALAVSGLVVLYIGESPVGGP